jgi:hypothetical protein
MALEPLRAHVLRMGHHFIDASVQGLVLGLITDGVGVSSFTESLMRGLASLVESVGSKLVDQVLKKAPQAVLMDAGSFLRLARHAAPRARAPRDRRAHDARQRGRHRSGHPDRGARAPGARDGRRGGRQPDYLFDAAFAVIPVGPLMRRAVDAGGSAIRSGGKSSSARAIRKASDGELKDLAAFLVRRRQEAP